MVVAILVVTSNQPSRNPYSTWLTSTPTSQTRTPKILLSRTLLFHPPCKSSSKDSRTTPPTSTSARASTTHTPWARRALISNCHTVRWRALQRFSGRFLVPIRFVFKHSHVFVVVAFCGSAPISPFVSSFLLHSDQFEDCNLTMFFL